MHSKMVKSGIVVLTGREKADVADADVVMAGSCRLLLECWWSRGREKTDVAWLRSR
jgi:hypothetical protein